MNYFITLCRKTEMKLKEHLEKELLKYYPSVINEDGFLYVRQMNCPVLLTAHMDTVHKEPVKEVVIDKTKDRKSCISSPQGIGGDDRCGIYMILRILEETEFRPSILFCEQEETGGIGSSKFCKTEYIEDLKELKFFIELDRANGNDLVYYDDENSDFHKWCKTITGYKESWGTFSDISNLSPVAKISSVNISCGYYKAHTTSEYVIWEEMLNSIETVKKLLEKEKEVEPFAYVEGYYARWKKNYYYGRYNEDYDYHYGNYSYGSGNYSYVGYSYGKGNSNYHTKKNKTTLYVLFTDKADGKQYEVTIEGTSEGDCWMTFFVDYPDTCFNDVLDYDVY